MSKKFKNREAKPQAEVKISEGELAEQAMQALSDLSYIFMDENGTVVPVAEHFPSVQEIPQEKIWSLQDAARQMIVGYKDSWWPSIHKMAHTLAVKDNATEAQCRTLFAKWGADLK